MEKKYDNLPATNPRQGIVDLVDRWFWDQAMQVTGKYNVNMIQNK